MVKVKVLHRCEADYRKTDRGLVPHFRNPDPQLHPFERAREYQRALTATKMSKMFAKPFVKALDGHLDAVKCMSVARLPGAPLVSGSCDGELRTWNLNMLETGTVAPRAHEGFVRGVSVSPSEGDRVLSCGDDKSIKLWELSQDWTKLGADPLMTYHTASIPNAVDHHWQKPMFVSVGDTVDIWDHQRSAPLNSFEWGCDRVITARFNPAEPDLVGSTAVDRSIGLYDLRGNSAIRKVILKMRSNALCWHPMNPNMFLVANEDCNLYAFDMRRLTAAAKRYSGHTMAVLDAKYSPSGTHFVSACYDATIRVWDEERPYCEDTYHTKRMQRVLCCDFSPDSRFVFSGSEDSNIRVWKAKADMKLGAIVDREARATAYREALKEKFKNMPEIRRIASRQRLPKVVASTGQKRRIMQKAAKRKEENRRRHAKPGAFPEVPLREKVVLREEE